jgi:cytochrome b6-f complex iron-sulfur subunit
MTTPLTAGNTAVVAATDPNTLLDPNLADPPLGAPGAGHRTSRRDVLVAAGLGAGALTLAACGSSSTAAAPASSASSAAAAAASGAGAPTGNTLVALSTVPVGGAVAATDANGKPIIVAQPTAGKVVAFSAICTHKQCTVKVAGADLDCPCHGSKYNALTGAVINGPAPSPLAPVSVSVSGGNVVAT